MMSMCGAFCMARATSQRGCGSPDANRAVRSETGGLAWISTGTPAGMGEFPAARLLCTVKALPQSVQLRPGRQSRFCPFR